MVFFMFGGRFRQSVRECFSPRHASVHRGLSLRGSSDAGKPFGARQFLALSVQARSFPCNTGFLAPLTQWLPRNKSGADLGRRGVNPDWQISGASSDPAACMRRDAGREDAGVCSIFQTTRVNYYLLITSGGLNRLGVPGYT